MKNYFGKIINFISHLNNKVNKSSFNNVKVVSNKVNFNKSLIYTKERKNYYLPLPINNNLVLVKFNYNILSNVTGLATIDSSLRLKLQNNLKYNKDFSIFMLKNITKILFYLFREPYFPTDKVSFVNNIFKCFSLGYKDILLLKKEDIDLIATKHINTSQHMLTIICNKFFIDIDNFVINKNIDFSDYSVIHISLIIEYFILYQNMSILKNNSNINIKFVNHENPIILESSDLFKTKESLASGYQSFCDLLFYKFLITSKETIEIIKNYRDIKANYRAIDKNHITLKLLLYSHFGTIDSYTNSFISYLKSKHLDKNVLKNPKLLAWVNDKINELTIIKQKIKPIKKDESKPEFYKPIMYEFNQKVFDMSFENEYKVLNLSFILAVDLSTDVFFVTNILPLMDANLEIYYYLFDLEIFFPKNNKIDLKQFYDRIILIIDTIMPEPMREPLKINLKNFLQILYG